MIVNFTARFAIEIPDGTPVSNLTLDIPMDDINVELMDRTVDPWLYKTIPSQVCTWSTEEVFEDSQEELDCFEKHLNDYTKEMENN